MTERTAKAYAVERWWHRLLRVIGYGMALNVLVLSLVLLLKNAEYFTYSYSFEPDYEATSGEEKECRAFESMSLMLCGGINNSEAFIQRYLKVKGNNNLKDGTGTVKEFFADLYAIGHEDEDLAFSVVSEKRVTYKQQRRWDGGKTLVAIIYALLITAAFLVALFVIYKVILFVVHGHTRVISAVQQGIQPAGPASSGPAE